MSDKSTNRMQLLEETLKDFVAAHSDCCQLTKRDNAKSSALPHAFWFGIQPANGDGVPIEVLFSNDSCDLFVGEMNIEEIGPAGNSSQAKWDEELREMMTVIEAVISGQGSRTIYTNATSEIVGEVIEINGSHGLIRNAEGNTSGKLTRKMMQFTPYR